MDTLPRNHNGQIKGPHKLDERPLKIWFEPKQKEGQIICHRRTADGEPVYPIIYDIDSSHPPYWQWPHGLQADWLAALYILGWKDRAPKPTTKK